MGENLVQCYNKGCGQKFDPLTNSPDACLYHPGPPYFHDAYKIWNCCQKKSTDFGTWLSYKGCTRGAHSNEKPAEDLRLPANKELIVAQESEDFVKWNGLTQPAERLSLNEQEGNWVQLAMEVTDAARAALERALHATPDNAESPTPATTALGTPCSNATCEQTFLGDTHEHGVCVHHPGVAIFHEGMKFWSCCNKKTSDFSAFLAQRGCTTGEHCWTKKERVDRLREDWFCRAGFVHINIYCRGALPDRCHVQSDGLRLRVHLVHNNGKAESDIEYELFGAIDAKRSIVVVGERKVELRLCQTTVPAWPRLRFQAQDS